MYSYSEHEKPKDFVHELSFQSENSLIEGITHIKWYPSTEQGELFLLWGEKQGLCVDSLCLLSVIFVFEREISLSEGFWGWFPWVGSFCWEIVLLWACFGFLPLCLGGCSFASDRFADTVFSGVPASLRKTNIQPTADYQPLTKSYDAPMTHNYSIPNTHFWGFPSRFYVHPPFSALRVYIKFLQRVYIK